MMRDNMAIEKKLLAGLNAAAKDDKQEEGAMHLADLMSDPAYLRHSSALINEALQKGFDVLQLANGDIVTTGTKTIVNTYSWDAAKGKLAKAKAPSSAAKRRARKGDLIDIDLD